MNLATIAMRNGNPSQALDHAESVLVEQPDNMAALNIKGRAHLRLRQYDKSLSTLNKLLEMNPDDVDVHRDLIDWAYSKMAFTLSKSDFLDDEQLQEEFTEAKTMGHFHAGWIAEREETKTEGEFIRARLILLDSRQLELKLEHERAILRHELVSSPDAEVTSPTIEELRRNVRSMKFRAEQSLQNVMVAKPGHFDSASIYIDLLIEREGWSGIWVLAQKIREQKDTPPHLARKVVAAVYQIPDQYKPKETRLEVSQAVLNTVTDTQNPAWSLTQTRLFMEANEPHKAYDIAERLFKIQPNDDETRFNYGWALFALKKYELAKTTLGPIAAEKKDSANIQSLYGRVLVKLGDERGAVDHLRRAVELDPDARIARSLLIQILSQNRQTADAALRDVEEFYNKNPNDPTAIRYMMQALISQDRTLKIQKFIETIKALSPQQNDYIRVVVSGHIYLKQLNQAMQYAKELVRLEPDVGANQILVATVHVRRGEIDEAKRIIQNLAERNPESTPVNLRLAGLLMVDGQFDQVVTLTESILKNDPQNLNARVFLASALARLALVEKSLDEIKIILKQDPKEPRAHELAARLYRVLGQENKAIEHLLQMDESTIDAKRYPGLAARVKLERGLIDEALAICDESIRQGTATALVRMILAEIQLNNKKDLVQGEVHLLSYARNNPQDAVPFQLLGRFYAKHNMQRGLVEFKKLRSVNEGHARLAEATLYFKYGRNTEALQTLNAHFLTLIRNKQALALTYATFMTRIVLDQQPDANRKVQPIWQAFIQAGFEQYNAEFVLLELNSKLQDSSTTTRQLISLGNRIPMSEDGLFFEVASRLSLQNEHAAALKLIDARLTKAPENINLLIVKADALVLANRLDEAVASFEAALKRADNPEPILLRLVQVHQQRFDFPASESIIDRLGKLGTGSNVTALWLKATLLNKLGLTEESVQVLEQLQQTTKARDPRMLLALGQRLASMGRMEEAKSILITVPPYAKQYFQAQVMVARIDESDPLTVEDAKKRLDRLSEVPAYQQLAVKELVRVARKTKDVKQISKWTDIALATPNLPTTIKTRWLQIRAELKARQADWIAVDKDIDAFLKLAPDALKWQIAKLAVLGHLSRTDEAKAFFAQHPTLGDDDNGKLLASSLSIAAKPPKRPFYAFLTSMAGGDFDAAERAVGLMPNTSDAVYRRDLLDDIRRVNAGEMDKNLFRQLALAAAAQTTGMHQITDAVCKNIARSSPNCLAAHALRLIASQSGDNQSQIVASSSVPDSSLHLFLKARELGKKDGGNIKEAIAAAHKLTLREPDHYPAALALIHLQISAGNINDALALMETWYAKPGPHQVIFANDLAFLLVDHYPNRLKDAHSAAMKAVELLPNDPRVLDTLGWVQFHQGQHADALESLSRCWSIQSGSPDWHYHIGRTYQALNNPLWARRHLDKTVKLGGTHKEDAAKRLEELEPNSATGE